MSEVDQGSISSKLVTASDISLFRSKATGLCVCSPPCACLCLSIIFMDLIVVAAIITGLIIGSQKTTISTIPTTTIKPPRDISRWVSMIFKSSVFQGFTGMTVDRLLKSITIPVQWWIKHWVHQGRGNWTRTIVFHWLNEPYHSNRGQCHFSGQISASTPMWQTINLLNYADSTFVDSYSLRFNLSAWIGAISAKMINRSCPYPLPIEWTKSTVGTEA